MTNVDDQKQIYIVISQTGTILSKLLKMFTGAEYNHASLSFVDDLSVMYSFGRLNAYNPFWAGFVTESKNFGTFKRFNNTKVKVLSIDVSGEKYSGMCRKLEQMISQKKNYRYNYFGLWLAVFNICIKMKNRYYCSEFVREMLVSFDIDGSKELEGIVHPMSFTKIPDAKTVYCGKLKDYSLD